MRARKASSGRLLTDSVHPALVIAIRALSWADASTGCTRRTKVAEARQPMDSTPRSGSPVDCRNPAFERWSLTSSRSGQFGS